MYIDAKDPARSLSARRVRTLVRQLSAGFNDHGLERADTVCMVSFNDVNTRETPKIHLDSSPQIHYTPIYLGIIAAGGCFTGANPGYTARELTHHLRITKAKFILTELKMLEISLASAKDCGVPHSNIFVLNFRNEIIPAGHRSWNVLLEHRERDSVEVNDESIPAAYASTSGTTGLPKAAIIPHCYLTSQAAAISKLLLAKDNVSPKILCMGSV